MRYNFEQVYNSLVLGSLSKFPFKTRARRSLDRLKLFPERSLARLQLKTMKKIVEGLKVKTMHRELIIIPEMVNKVVNVHNGKIYVPLKITEDKVGIALGSFVPSKKVLHVHTSKNKDKTKNLDKKN